MTTPSRASRTTSGRRVGQLLVAAALPLVTAAALLGVRTGAPTVPTDGPSLTELTRVSLACPAAADEATRTVSVLSPTGQGGVINATVVSTDARSDPKAIDPRALDLKADRLTTARIANPVVVTGRDEMAPGLLAARLGERAGVGCTAPQPQAWFPGVGARPAHGSSLLLTNPDPGPAIADITVQAPSGTVDAPSLRGIRVAGNTSTTIDLAEVVPRRTELSVQVEVSRGRLTGAVLDRVEVDAGKSSSADWLAPLAEPAESSLLLGLPTGSGSRRLTLANPGTDETTVEISIVSPQSVFTPRDFPEISLPPGASRSVELGALLAPQIEAGATGLLVETSHPVAVALRSTVDGDLTHTATLPAITGEASALLPRGSKELILAGAERPGVAVVRTRDAAGRTLERRRVEIDPDSSVTLGLPKAAVSVALEVQRTSVRAAVLAESGRGAVVLGLAESMLQGLVPAVRPNQGSS